MKLEGRIWKSRDSKFWLAEVRDLELVTQGKSRKDAAAMLADAVECLVNHDRFRVDGEDQQGWRVLRQRQRRRTSGSAHVAHGCERATVPRVRDADARLSRTATYSGAYRPRRR